MTSKRTEIGEKAKGPVSGDTLNQIQADLSVPDRLNFALLHSGCQHDVECLKLTNCGLEVAPPLTLELCVPAFADSAFTRVSSILPGQSVELSSSVQPRMRPEKVNLLAVPQAAQVQLWVQGRLLAERSTTVLPMHVWNWNPQFHAALAAFVVPEHGFVHAIVRRAQNQLEAHFPDATPTERAEALCTCLKEEFPLRYAWERPEQGLVEQRIRFPHDLAREWKGTCVDVALLLADCLENVRVSAVICLLEITHQQWHAMVGLWTDNQPQPEVVTRGKPQALRLQNLGRLLLIDVEELLRGRNFKQARHQADAHLRQHALVGLIDIEAARARGITPLPLIEPPAGLQASGGPKGETRTDSQGDIPPSRLVIISGPIATREFAIDRSPMVIGRSAPCDILLSSDIISNPHAELAFAQGSFYLTDKSSKNGTFLISGAGRMGEDRLQPGVATPLKPGARFRVGRVVLKLDSLAAGPFAGPGRPDR